MARVLLFVSNQWRSIHSFPSKKLVLSRLITTDRRLLTFFDFNKRIKVGGNTHQILQQMKNEVSTKAKGEFKFKKACDRSVICVLAKNGCNKLALKMFEQMKIDKIEADESIYIHLLRMCEISNDSYNFINILQHMEKENIKIKPNTNIHQIILKYAKRTRAVINNENE